MGAVIRWVSGAGKRRRHQLGCHRGDLGKPDKSGHSVAQFSRTEDLGRVMQALNLLGFGLAIGALVVFGTGCGWQKTMSFPSPSGRSSVQIWQTRVANEMGIQVLLESGTSKKELWKRSRESLVYFVHVCWSQDESQVAVYGSGLQAFGVAADVRTGNEIPFESLRHVMEASIAQAYDLPPGTDPLKWASSNPAFGAFAKHHPEIHP